MLDKHWDWRLQKDGSLLIVSLFRLRMRCLFMLSPAFKLGHEGTKTGFMIAKLRDGINILWESDVSTAFLH
ncbi:unnamed protein product [Musa textilis]